MNRTISYGILIGFIAASVAVVAARPDWVSDQNEFLKHFVGGEFLGVLGVILAITLASVVGIHFEFNKLEERHGKVFLAKSRQNLSNNSYSLIGLFVLAVALVSIKPILCGGPTAQSVANLGALFILIWHVLLLVSLTELAFAIGPDIPEVK